MVAGLSLDAAVTRTVAGIADRFPGVAAGAVSAAVPARSVACAGRLAAAEGPPVGTDTVFEIGSVTKVFTSLLLAEAVRRGEVEFGTPLRDLVPAGVRVPELDGRQIMLEHLATHTSGLPRSPLRRAAELRAALTGVNPYARVTGEDLYESLSGTRLRRVPGTGPVWYSNFGVALLGYALVAAAGAAEFGALVRTRIADPLRLADTAVTAGPQQRQRLAAGHRHWGRATPHWQLPGMVAAGGLLSTLSDLLSFLRAQLRPDDTSLADALRATHQLRRSGRRTGIGLGWLHAPLGGTAMLWHNGGTGGFRSFAAFAPRHGVAVAVLVNSSRSPDLAGLRLLRAVTA
jgi:serine-type D-Ala-D-Ala carboxypeptidase/endopeptidase